MTFMKGLGAQLVTFEYNTGTFVAIFFDSSLPSLSELYFSMSSMTRFFSLSSICRELVAW